MNLSGNEAGLGLVELLIAMTVTAIALTALIAGLSSGAKALERSSTASNGASVADAEMERYRAEAYGSIWCPGEDPTTVLDTVPAAPVVCATPSPFPTVVAGDGRAYSVETTVGYACPIGTLTGTVGADPAGGTTGPTCTVPVTTPPTPPARPTKLVRVVVRDPSGKLVHRQTSTFDRALHGS